MVQLRLALPYQNSLCLAFVFLLNHVTADRDAFNAHVESFGTFQTEDLISACGSVFDKLRINGRVLGTFR
jgi:hypothetical protein